ncbi:MAG: alpha/beta hydrolase [Alphaproteobacteria bacterium]|nr:alpha/beta hydrolase [Alphaproteobacteria bacterium]
MRAALCLASALLALPAATGAGELVTIPTRPGVTQSYFLVTAPKGEPAAVAILMPGGDGNIRMRIEDGQPRFGPRNFVVRIRGMLAERGVAGAILDVPSDQSGGMSDGFRASAEHATDVRAVIADLDRRLGPRPTFLLTTSRSTISGAHLGRALGVEIAGVILTSTLWQRGGRNPYPVLSRFDFTSIRAPLLLVHHREDSCVATPYREAARLAERFALISVRGGRPPESDDCEPFAPHGFFGREEEVTAAMVAWMLRRPFAREIE